MSPDAPASMQRRRFVRASGALIVYFSVAPRLGIAQKEAQNVGKTPSQTPLPGSLKTEPFLDSWIRIDEKGNVTVLTGKAELGQGIKTALIQVAAEELVVNPAGITLITADTARTANEGYTAGSHSMQDSGTAIRHAAAQVREILFALAAARLNTTTDQITATNGTMRGKEGTTIGYGELVAGQNLHVQATTGGRLRDPAEHVFVGKPWRRIDIPAKVTGGVAYIQDLRLERMMHGRVIRPPSPQAKLREIASEPIEKMPGVTKVVRDGSFLAVVAQREYEAVTAMRALARAAVWDETASLPDAQSLYAAFQAFPRENYTILDQGILSGSGKTIEATYRRPFQLHGSIGPSCAIAQLENDSYTVWTHSQGVYPLRNALAEMLAVPKEQIRCIHVEGSGCYGHNAADDVAADAALLARSVPGIPVRVQWMREDEHTWEPYGPPMIMAAKAALDASGNVSEWQYEVWSNTHSTRPGAAGNLLAATHLQQAFTAPPPKPLPQPEGGGDRNAIPLYTFPNARVVHHFIPQMPLRVSALRSLGAYANVFALESFMDELALAAKLDPVEFRLRHMRDERASMVIRRAAERFEWAKYQKRPGRGRGFAFARYKNLGAYAAVAFDVEVQRESGLVRVRRAVAAVDSGEAVNPDGIRNQIEGGIVQSLSWTLAEEVTFDRTRITSRDWGGYPILRFSGVPDSVEVNVIDRPGQPFLGTGEATQGPTAAALANAVADAMGVRIRDLPLSRSRIRAAAGL